MRQTHVICHLLEDTNQPEFAKHFWKVAEDLYKIAQATVISPKKKSPGRWQFAHLCLETVQICEKRMEKDGIQEIPKPYFP